MSIGNIDKKEGIAFAFLSVGAKIASRLLCKTWQFAVFGLHYAQVINKSRGIEKEEYTSVIGLKERKGIAVPAKCKCPEETHLQGSKYNHRVAVALAKVAGSIVLYATTELDYPSGLSCPGGVIFQNQKFFGQVSGNIGHTCPIGHSGCVRPENDDLPLRGCYSDTKDEFRL